MRFVWEYIGHSNRVPLPCCVYNTIREFPDELGEYRGFEEEEEESDDNDQLLEEDI